MSLSEVMVQELSQESVITRKLLERLAEDKLSWKPHEKSMSLGRLATHIGEIPRWAEAIVNHETFDMGASSYTPLTLGSCGEILEAFQKNVDAFADILKGKSDGILSLTWKLTQGDRVIVALPRAAALRAFVLSHIIHHRGQLSVYLRLNNVPLPGIYGPSADET